MTQKVENRELSPFHRLHQRKEGKLLRNGSAPSVYSRISVEGGFSLVSAIFLLVVIAALGTFAVTLTTTQQQNAALDIMGSRAYQAAHAGIEWGAYQVLPGSAAAFASTCRTGGSNSQMISPLSGTLAGFTVTVNCAASSYTEGASTVWGYQLAVSATQGVPYTLDYVERSIASDIWIAE